MPSNMLVYEAAAVKTRLMLIEMKKFVEKNQTVDGVSSQQFMISLVMIY